MKYQLVVVVDAETLKEAAAKIPDGIEVLSAQVKPDRPQQQSGVANVFSRTSGTAPQPQ